MMYVDLVDMDDFIAELAKFGIFCQNRDAQSVKQQLLDWAKNATVSGTSELKLRLAELENAGILIPEVEELVIWSQTLEA